MFFFLSKANILDGHKYSLQGTTQVFTPYIHTQNVFFFNIQIFFPFFFSDEKCSQMITKVPLGHHITFHPIFTQKHKFSPKHQIGQFDQLMCTSHHIYAYKCTMRSCDNHMINSLKLLVHLRDGLFEHGGKLRWVEVTDALTNGRLYGLVFINRGTPSARERERVRGYLKRWWVAILYQYLIKISDVPRVAKLIV